MTAPKLARETFAISRASEFFELRALQSQTGQPAGRFGDVLVKELVDNALDACETAGVPPQITITEPDPDWDRPLVVADNGPGIASDVLDGILDFTVLVSDKAAYKSPTRGQQGNALKTVFGIPFALGSSKPVLVDALGVRHVVHAGIDPSGEVRIVRHREKVRDADGTSWTVPLPGIGVDVAAWARRFAVVNPHAEVVAYLANDDDADSHVSYKPTAGDGWRKPVPTDPTSPHWYDDAAMLKLVFAYISNARRGGRDLPLGEFIRSFAGLSSPVKAKTVAGAVPGITHLSDFDTAPRRVADLLAAMQAAAKVPKPAVLGRVDEAHYRACFADWYGVRRFWFKRAAVLDGTVPWVMEVAAAETEKPGELFFAVNYSPTFDDPLSRLPLSFGELRTTGAGSFLKQADAYPDGESCRAAAIHLISPGVQFLDKGKQMLAVPHGAG